MIDDLEMEQIRKKVKEKCANSQRARIEVANIVLNFYMPRITTALTELGMDENVQVNLIASIAEEDDSGVMSTGVGICTKDRPYSVAQLLGYALADYIDTMRDNANHQDQAVQQRVVDDTHESIRMRLEDNLNVVLVSLLDFREIYEIVPPETINERTAREITEEALRKAGTN